jgi:hypothetical protein
MAVKVNLCLSTAQRRCRLSCPLTWAEYSEDPHSRRRSNRGTACPSKTGGRSTSFLGAEHSAKPAQRRWCASYYITSLHFIFSRLSVLLIFKQDLQNSARNRFSFFEKRSSFYCYFLSCKLLTKTAENFCMKREVSSHKTDTYSSTLFAGAGANARASGQTLPEDRWGGGGCRQIRHYTHMPPYI